jgi:hypothetical protein
MKEHDLHNALFALDDVRERVDALTTILRQTSKTLATLQDYLESLL